VLAPDEVERAARGAEVLIGHGGSGFVSLALRCGRTPLVLPRRAARGEHVDDHQVRMLDELERAGLAVSLERTPLADAIEHGRCPPAPRTWDAPRLVDRVGALLA
jgi:UDP-N-acetylglucosamine transferase subunit ALG13